MPLMRTSGFASMKTFLSESRRAAPTFARVGAIRRSTAADQDPLRQHEPAAEHHFGDGRERRRIHETPLDPGDSGEFEHDYDARDDRGGHEIRDEIGQGVADAAG